MNNEYIAADSEHESDHTATLRSVVGAATTVVDGVVDGQLTNATPCDEWNVRDLLHHLVTTAAMFATAAERGYIPDDVAQELAGDVLGTDFSRAWKDASEQLCQAFEQPEVLDRVLALPFGDARGEVAVDLAVLEIGIHSADLARATGQDITDQAPFAAVLDTLRARMIVEWRAPGILKDEQPAPPRASTVEKLLAYAGRRIDGAPSATHRSDRRPSGSGGPV